MTPLQILETLEGGKFITDLADKVHEATREARAINGTAKIDVKLEIQPNGRNQVRVKTVIKTTMPLPARDDTLFFADANDNLTRQDPEQELDFGKVVEMPSEKAAGQ